MTFENARILVTGAASGLGAALVERFRAAGARVLGTDLTEAPGVVRHDITSDDDWADVRGRVEAEWGGLDVLVNNAGIAGGGRIELCTLEEWHRMFEVNLFGLVRGTRTFTPVFKQQGSGRIVNVASLAGLVHPAGMGSYNAAKAAVVAFTETTGHELASAGVRAHAVCPSYFRTNLLASMEGSDHALGAVMARLVEESPISADDIASAVLEGIERGDELIVPDEPARAAYALKREDRAAYDAVMRDQASKLERVR
jgi:NAD(P)-dependent dehydrogenase (short-subunit alcohol dehydrogenase family)